MAREPIVVQKRNVDQLSPHRITGPTGVMSCPRLVERSSRPVVMSVDEILSRSRKLTLIFDVDDLDLL